jgi:signal transduction histidine kinase
MGGAQQESEETSAVIHELAGILSSLQGFSEIVESRPDHPDRERLISILRQEARRASQALKDLQVFRALDAGKFGDRVEAVSLDDVLASTSDVAPVPEDLPAVRADPLLAPEVIARCIELASELNPQGRAEVVRVAEAAEVRIAMGSDLDPEEIDDGVRTGRAPMRPFALARRLLERWGGSVRVEPSGSQTFVVLVLANFS